MAKDEAYRKAEKRIEEARVSGATELNLSNMKLPSLPEALLGGLTNGRGNALSDAMTLVETYRRADDADNAALGMTVVITDPGHLAAPWELGWRKLQTHDYEFAAVNCRPPVLGNLR